MKHIILSSLLCFPLVWAAAGCKKQPTESTDSATRHCFFLDGTCPVSGKAVLFRRDPWLGGLTGMGQRHVLDTVPIELGSIHWPKEMAVAEFDITALHVDGTLVHRENVSVWEGDDESIVLPTPFWLSMHLQRPLPFHGTLHVRRTESSAPPTLADWVNSSPSGAWMHIEPDALPLPLELEWLFPISADTHNIRLHWFEQSVEHGLVPRSLQVLAIPKEDLMQALAFSIQL